MSGGRLDVIKSLIEPAETIADVGCDHAKIAEYCVKNGLAKQVIASDISEQCLQKARNRLSNCKNVMFVCCDGIRYVCDEAVIAGMGGLLISEILNSAEKLPQTLVLCPHRDEDCVRKTLLSLDYGIDRDVPVEERGKFYSVIRAVLGGGLTELNELQLLFGIDCYKPNAALKTKLEALYNSYMRAPQHNEARIEKVTTALQFQNECDNLQHNK